MQHSSFLESLSFASLRSNFFFDQICFSQSEEEIN